MEQLKQELQQLEKLEQEEEEELKKFLQELAQQDQHQQTVQRIYQDVESFVELNREIIELTELMEEEPDNFRKIYRKLKSLISKHDEMEENLIQELRQLGVPDKQLNILYKTDQKMENIDKQVVEEIGEKRTQQAARILDNRPKIYFKAEALQKFLSAVKREQLDRGAEVPGVFGFEKTDDGYLLNNFLELENTNPNYGTFSLDEQINYVLENFGNKRNIIIAHSHPIGDFNHSGTDKDLISKANNIGVIGVPKDFENIYPVPEALENGSWMNLPSAVVENGQVLSDQELERSFPKVLKYNNALKKAVSKGNEDSWPRFI